MVSPITVFLLILVHAINNVMLKEVRVKRKTNKAEANGSTHSLIRFVIGTFIIKSRLSIGM